MEFQHHKIHKSKRITFSVPIIALIVIIITLSVGIIKTISTIDFSVFLKAAGHRLEKDSLGHTNFLLLGTGGGNHDGAELTDTMIVASLDDKDKLVTMISIPRDLYTKDDIVGDSRINEVALNAKKHFGTQEEGLAYMKGKVEEIVGVPIHYWVQIDFQGFTDLVDAIGGVDVEVKNAIQDPYYPKDGTYEFETFTISKGAHHLDGETALKYARSRKTTSDFDRAQRQQEIIFAIKEKALKTEILFDGEKIADILKAIKKNMKTNINIKEILTLGSIAKDYSSDSILKRLIHDDPAQCGGFLYTPERQYYYGMFVLIPAGGIEFVHKYADMNFTYPLINHEEARIQVLNGTKGIGIAGETKQILKRFCLNVTRFGNAKTKDIEKTTYYYTQKYDENGKKINSRPVTLDFLQTLIPGEESTEIPQEYIDLGYTIDADIIIELGNDYVSSENYIADPFNSLPLPVHGAAKTTDTDEDK